MDPTRKAENQTTLEEENAEDWMDHAETGFFSVEARPAFLHPGIAYSGPKPTLTE